MTEVFSKIFEVDPVAKGRPRFNSITGHTYTPQKTAVYERALRLIAIKHYKKPPAKGALTVELYVFLKPPKSMGKPGSKSYRDFHTVKPDCDNFGKCLDAFNGVLWVDDSQIISLTVAKYYSARAYLDLRVYAVSD